MNLDSFAIDAAIFAVIDAADTLPAVYENGGTELRPYLDVSQATTRRETIRIKGGHAQREIGSYAVTVVVDEGTNTKAAKGYADQVIALFPNGLRLPFSGGIVTIGGQGSTASERRPGFNADAEYRVPVIIPYTALAT